MLDPGTAVKQSKLDKPASTAPATMIVGGIVFGFLFGFLLQKGGVGTYHILIGQLLFQDWTVVKIMLTEIVVGIIGIFTLHHFAKVNLHTKPTKLLRTSLEAYSSGLGSRLSVIAPARPLLPLAREAGTLFSVWPVSWLYAEMSGTLKQTIEEWGNLGKLTLCNVLPASRGAVVVSAAVVLATFLIALEAFSAR